MESNTKIYFDIEAIKQDILKELEEAHVKVIPTTYNGAKELVKVIEKIHDLTREYDKTYPVECEKIRQRYSAEVSLKKINELELDYISEKASLTCDLDSILDKEIKYRKEALRKNIDNADYQRSRSEAVSILLNLGDKLDTQTTFEIIRPIVEAKDLTFLKILENTSSKEARYIYKRAIEQAEEFVNVDDLRKAIEQTKLYANNPQRGKNVILENFIYKTDYKAYDRMRKNK